MSNLNDGNERRLEDLQAVSTGSLELECVMRWVCRRRGLTGSRRLSFRSFVASQIMANDFESPPGFQGRSSLRTYLVALVSRLYLDFDRQRQGGESSRSAPGPRELLVRRVVRRRLAGMPAREQLLLRLHFQSGLTVHELSRSRSIVLEWIRRRKADFLEGLRAELVVGGMAAADADELLSMVDWNAAFSSPRFAELSGGEGSDIAAANP